MRRMLKKKNRRLAIVLLIVSITAFFSLLYYNFNGKDKDTSSFAINDEASELEGRIVVQRPTLSQTSFNYTGGMITPTVNGYDGSVMTRSGENSASSPGTYQILINLKDPSNYQWSDGSTSTVVLNWRIVDNGQSGYTMVPKPTLSQTTYMETGSTISPSINNYNGSIMTKSGATAASSPGSYTIYIHLNDVSHYHWSDGSTGTVTLNWTIKARTKVQTPTLAQSEYWETGGTISPSINNYDSNVIKMSGTTSASSPGTYEITFSLRDTSNYTWSDGSISPRTYTWRIIARTRLQKPALQQTTYTETGSYITPTIMYFDGSAMGKSGDTTAKNPGNYNIRITLSDPTRFAWSDGSTGALSLNWTIKAKTKVPKPTISPSSYMETGSYINPNMSGFDSSIMNREGALSAKDPGTYTINVTLKDPSNYQWADGSSGMVSLTWTITSRTKLNRPTLNQSSYMETGGTITPSISGFDSNTMNKSGALSATNPGTYEITISIKNTANYTWSDGSTAPMTLTWQIKARTRLPKPTLPQTTFMETGNTITPTISGFDTGTMSRSGSYYGTNPGSYQITISLKNTTNYTWSDGSTDPVKLNWTIKEKTRLPKPTLSTTSIVETGSMVGPNINGFDPSTMIQSGDIAAVNPGTYHITVNLRDTSNYKWSDGSTGPVTLTWKITGRTRLTKPTLATQSYVATGNPITPAINGFDGSLMTKYGDVQGTSPGTYTIYIKLSNTSNYVWSDGSTDPVPLTWKIVQGTVTINKPTLNQSSFVETGGTITPPINGYDENVMTKSGDVSATNPGNYQIKITLKDPGSYKWADGSTSPIYLSWNIKEKTRIQKPTLETSTFVQTGGDITPTINGFDSEKMTKSGDLTKKDPGTYTITVSLNDTLNYKWSDGTLSPVTLTWKIVEKTKLTKPTLATATFDETGEDITPTINGFDENTMTKTGDLVAKDPGTYTITISLKDTDAYAWSDDSISEIALTWDIKEVVGEVLGTLEYTITTPDDNKPIAGVLVEVHNRDTDEVVFSGKSNTEGKVIVQGLPEGDYYVVEKEAPDGYQVNGVKKTFSILEDGEVVKLSINNKPLVNPSTARPSLKILSFYSVLLVIIGFVLFTLRKKKRIHRIG